MQLGLGSWMVSGGVGAIGSLTAEYLSQGGAQGIHLLGRSGGVDGKASQIIQQLGSKQLMLVIHRWGHTVLKSTER